MSVEGASNYIRQNVFITMGLVLSSLTHSILESIKANVLMRPQFTYTIQSKV